MTDRGSRIEDRRSRIEDRRSKIEDRRSRIEDRGAKIEQRSSMRSSILYLRSSIFDPLSSILYLRSSIFYPLSSILCLRSSIFDPLSSILYLRSSIFDPLSSILCLRSSIFDPLSSILYPLPSLFRHAASEVSLLVVQTPVLPRVAVNARHVEPCLFEGDALDPFFDLRRRQFLKPLAHSGRAAVVCGGGVFEAIELVHQLFNEGRAELDVEDRVVEVVGCDGARSRLAGHVPPDVWQKLH